ncbi:MAG TPA: MFS transporter, partial [Frankiaceae bacterium]|nr:MFS transporter [Frankiaceae bacterium]
TGWRPIFLLNVPVGLVGLWLAARRLPETRAPRATHLDLAGTTLLAATLVAVLVPLTEGRALGWPPWSWLLLASAAVTGTAFCRTERRVERAGRTPLVPPSVLGHPSMRRGLLLAAPFFAGFSAFMFVYALVTQDALGLGPLAAGLALAPMAAAFLLASLQTPALVARHGRSVITAGALIQLAGLLVLAVTLTAAWPQVRPAQLGPALLVAGYGQGLVMSPLVRVVLSQVPLAAAGAGSGVMTTTQQVSLALGVATLGTLFVTLAPTGRLGALHATVVVVGIQAVVAAGLAWGSRGLPRTG